MWYHEERYVKDDRCIGKCTYCGGEANNNLFCKRKCLRDYNYLIYINKWKLELVDGRSGKYGLSSYIKRYLLEKYNYSCQVCGYNDTHPITGNPILDIHHIDGNCLNRKENNLQVLCPNCHRKTDNHGSTNKNNKISFKERVHYL